MKITGWSKAFDEYEKFSRGQTDIDENGAHIKLTGPYSVANISCKISEFDNNKYIVVNDGVNNIKAEVFKVIRWYDKEDNLLLCEFLNRDHIKPMEDSSYAEITYTVFGAEENIRIENFKAGEGEAIKERKAIVAAAAIDYGPWETHHLRTCEDNLRQSIEQIDRACKNNKPDIFVLTETFISRNISGDPLEETFDNLNGPRIKKLRDKAKEHGIYLAFSIREIDDEGICYNSCVVLDRNGEIIADYHKTHLTRNEVAMGLKRGDEAVVIDTDFGKCGIAICWDLFFPEFVRTLAKKGAEIIINPTAGYHYDMHSIRAKDNGVYILTAGAQFSDAVIINPDGKLLADGKENGIAKAEIDLNERFPVFPAYSERRSVYFNEIRNEIYDY